VSLALQLSDLSLLGFSSTGVISPLHSLTQSGQFPNECNRLITTSDYPLSSSSHWNPQELHAQILA
jgi:hypothetical protein